MKSFIFLICVSFAVCLPPQEENARSGRNIFTDLLGNIGVLRVIPRQCTSTSSLLRQGMCTLDNVCTNLGGAIAGECPRIGACCVVPAVCNTQTTAKRSWYINLGFPGAADANAAKPCELTIEKSDDTIVQVKLELELMELTSTTRGACITDTFQVLRVDDDGKETDLAPVLCGDNSGQHLYIDMPKTGSKLKLRTTLGDVRRDERAVDRQWRVMITQLDETEAAPSRCLQYFDNKKGTIRSLNYHSGDIMYASNMEYDICFRTLEAFEDEADKQGDPSTINVCIREAFGVNVQQSFVRKSRTGRQGSIKSTSSGMKVSSGMVDSSAADVKSQIEKVVSQLSGGSQPQSVSDEAAKIKEKIEEVNKAVINQKEATKVIQDSVPAPAAVEETPVESVKSTEDKKEVSGMTMVDTKAKPNSVASDASENEIVEVEAAASDVVKDSGVTTNVDKKVVKNKKSQGLTNEMKNLLNSPDCGGSYLVVNGEKICGSFHRETIIDENQDERFSNMDRVSLRTFGIPKTALRFNFDYRVMCTKTTLTTAPPSPSTTAASSETSNNTGTTEGQRRVNIFRYILGLY